MTPGTAIVQRLLALAAVTALVGTRIYKLRLPQSPLYPAVRVQEVSETQPAGGLRGQGGPARTRVQVDAYVAEASGVDAHALVDQVTAAIAGTGGGTGLAGWQGTVGTLRITGILPVDRTVTYAPDDLRVLIGRQDFFVWTQPAA